jgi:outer membrane protein OmpA-like peptidoglycan-associated protein
MKRLSLWMVVRFVGYACGLAAVTASGATGKSPSSLVPTQGSVGTSCSTMAHSVVFFDDRSPRVTAEAEENLFNVLSDFWKSRSTGMKLVGYTEGSGNVEHNQALSRADAVKVWMVARGVTPAAITTELRANCPGVEEIEGAREPQNRRVEISFNEDK